MHDRIVRLFTDHFGEPPAAILELRADGSNRTYFRLVGTDGRTAIGAFGPDQEESRAFLSFSRSFRSIGLPVPEIYGEDLAAGVWLEEDLGDTTLFDALVEARDRSGERFPETILPVYRRVVELLPRFQIEGGRVVDYTVAYPRAAFDRQSMLWDLNYFKYHFLKLAHIPFSEARLEEDFHRLTEFLLQADTSHFLYRDFQSRNIMLGEGGEPWFIDYQGGRRGAPQYDIASLLYDAKADIPDAVREELLEHYLDALEHYLPIEREQFLELYRGYVLVRIMQAMGAYGYRGFFERKPRFLQSVPYAARNIDRILARGLPVRLPELTGVFRRIVATWAHRAPEEGPAGLTVFLGSFSYRRGHPEDVGGHGGGFVFDCRGLPNPGRHLEFATLCGRDAPVVAYLERSLEVERFWEHVSALVDAQVQEYLRRGFTSLAVWFGCTGGQHRSVYMAERLARHLRERYPQVHVRLAHREEGAWAGTLAPREEAAVGD
ncbi:MAG: phosphotransferase [Gemmatimonadetes bacterium]|nr:phosphotransferase [Gemmatimonadota bacterium]